MAGIWEYDDLARIGRAAFDYVKPAPMGSYGCVEDYSADFDRARDFEAYYLDHELEDDSDHTPGFDHAWERFMLWQVGKIATRSCQCGTGELRPVQGTTSFDWHTRVGRCQLACTGLKCKRRDQFDGSRPVQLTEEETRLTVSESWSDEVHQVNWTVRHGRTVIIKRSQPAERGMWDSDPVRSAIAAHFQVSPESIHFDRKRGEGHRIIPHQIKIPKGSILIAA